MRMVACSELSNLLWVSQVFPIRPFVPPSPRMDGLGGGRGQGQGVARCTLVGSFFPCPRTSLPSSCRRSNVQLPTLHASPILQNFSDVVVVVVVLRFAHRMDGRTRTRLTDGSSGRPKVPIANWISDPTLTNQRAGLGWDTGHGTAAGREGGREGHYENTSLIKRCL